MPKKKTKINKGKIDKTKLKINPKVKEEVENYKTIETANYIIKKIKKDGNCFYRALSYFYRDTEDDHNKFRNLIISYIDENKKQYIEYIADEDVDIPKEQAHKEEYKKLKKTEYINKYIKEAYKESTYAGDK